MGQRLAVLVDGDNIAARHAARIQATAQKYGPAHVTRVYVNAQINSGWLAEPGFRIMHAGTGKNAGDLLLTIDAMELALSEEFDRFLIVSSDGDFTHLAQRLREKGLHVTGMGEKKAPTSFRKACSQFVEIKDQPCKVPASTTKSPVSKSAANDPGAAKSDGTRSEVTDLDLKIRAFIKQHSQNGAGMRINDLAPKMHQTHKIKISEQSEKTWRGYLSKRKDLYALDPRGPDAKVRFIPEGFSVA